MRSIFAFLLFLALLLPGCRAPNEDSFEDRFKRASQVYIEQRGLQAFWDEYYNLLGTSDPVSLHSSNRELALALGLSVAPGTTTLSRSEVDGLVDRSLKKRSRALLYDLFRENPEGYELGRAQNSFVLWHFSARDDYGSVALTAEDSAVVGWNVEKEFGPAKKEFFTFGLIGCTLSGAFTPDGKTYLSHYDSTVFDHLGGLVRFLRKNPDATALFVGVSAQPVAQEVLTQVKPQRIMIHQKRTYLEESYAIRIRSDGGDVEVEYAAQPVESGYIESIHNGDYGRWFCHGRFSQIFPPSDAHFKPLPLEVLGRRP